MPINHLSEMDVMNSHPALDSYNRIPQMSDTKRIISKAASYTCLAEESGSVYVATAAATFTLPTLATALSGWNAWFFNAANTDMAVASDPSDKMVTDNDAAADSITFSTSGHKIGGAVFVVTDGSLWYTFQAGNGSAVGTVATS